jgi:uncharacterized membrane protein YeiH
VTAPRPRPGPPRWLVVLLAAGISLMIAAVLLVVLQVAGVDRLDQVGFIVLIVVAALAGGSVTRWLVPRLPPTGRHPRS